MARIRTIKPEFFQHEALYDAERESELPLRIAFAGLWTVADRAGRFEWRPRQLKLNVLPYDDCDFAAVLSALESAGFVHRYEIDGKSYGYIPSWEKHQHLNVREPGSTIPPPVDEQIVQVPDEAGACTVPVPGQDAGKGREGKGTGKGRRVDDAHLLTPGLDLQAWERWSAYRTEIRKPIRPASVEAAVRHLARYGPEQAAVVEQSIANGWQGLFELKRLNGAGGKPTRRAKSTAELEAEEAARAVQ